MRSSMTFCTIINFCSADYPFLRPCIEAVKPFSSQILVPVCDHFFDGKKEDPRILAQIYAESADVEFLEFPFNKESFYDAHYWHNLARLLGCYFLNPQCEYVLFVDCDEIADTQRMTEWLGGFAYQDFDLLRLLNYWYFRESHLQATTWEDTPLLAKKSLLTGTLIMNERERAGIYDDSLGKKKRRVAGLDDKPLFHHYSWVRTKEQLLHKTSRWGHCKEKNWSHFVNEEFSRPFNGTDFVHGYAFTHTQPFIDIDLLQTPKKNLSSNFSHVRRLSLEDVFKIEISLTYQIPICL